MKHALVTVAAVAILTPTTAQSQTPEVLIFGGEGHTEFLGCLSCAQTSPQSVWNDFSNFGWANGFGTWNPFGEYKNPFSSYSACNQFASDPPVLVDRRGNYYGRLTINEFLSDSICSAISGHTEFCRALKVMCAT